MCKSLIADSFLARLGRLTEYLPGVNEVVELVMELVVPKSVVAAACTISQPAYSGSPVCRAGTPYGGDNLFTPFWCNNHWDYGYTCYYWGAVLVNGAWKYYANSNYNHYCSQWVTGSSCPACYTGVRDKCV
jgi:hypothetical protein